MLGLLALQLLLAYHQTSSLSSSPPLNPLMDPPHRDRPKRNRSPERARSPIRRSRGADDRDFRNEDRGGRHNRETSSRSSYYDHDMPRNHRGEQRDDMERGGGVKKVFYGERDEDAHKTHSHPRSAHSSTTDTGHQARDTKSSSVALVGPPARPDEGLLVGQDLSRPSFKVLDDETYAKRIEEQLDAIKSQERAEEEAEEARKRRREMFAKLNAQTGASSSTAPAPSTPSAKKTSSPTKSSTTSLTKSARAGHEDEEKDSAKKKSLSSSNGTGSASQPSSMHYESVFKPIQTSSTAFALKAVEEDDDMFAETFVDKVEAPSTGVKVGHNGVLADSGNSNVTGAIGSAMGGKHQTASHQNLIPTSTAAADDDEGYYSFTVGELLAQGRYEVLGFYGKGVYSNVIRAHDHKPVRKLNAGASSSSSSSSVQRASTTPSSSLSASSSNLVSSSISGPSSIVAIKLLRNNAHMKRSGKKEVKILRRLNELDPEGKCFCMKLEDSFEEHGHLCLVFEALDMNLTEVIKMYGHHVGLHIKAVRSYAFKMFKALSLLKRCNVIHADIKPDNVLVSKDRGTVKLADFGTAFESQEATMTTQLVSRFYRAPEIILGMPHSFPLDIFSMGCCLYELATGRYLLPSKDENHHLSLIMELQGPFSKKMLSACHPPFLEQHFAQDGKFLERYTDPLDETRVMVRRVEMPQKPSRDLAAELLASYTASGSAGGDQGSSSMVSTDVEVEWVQRLADLINRCITLDPRKRITPEEALAHGFF